MDTTELAAPDGSIESAIAGLIQPEEQPEEELETEELDAEVEDESEDSEEPETEEEYEDDEDPEEAEESAPESFTVKVDGKEVEVSLDELKRGYSGQQYVQKGMQEAAELRKQSEAVYSALLNERQQLNQIFQLAQQGGLMPAPQEPSKSMFESDPIGYMEAKLQYDESKAAYDQQMQMLGAYAQQQSQAEQMATKAYLQREMETLKQVVPEFADKEKASEVRDRLMSKGQEIYGYDPSEISAVMDHRAIRVLNDALKYQELMSGKKRAETSAKPKNRRTIKAGAKKTSSKSSAERQTRQKLKKSGSIDDALGLIFQS